MAIIIKFPTHKVDMRVDQGVIDAISRGYEWVRLPVHSIIEDYDLPVPKYECSMCGDKVHPKIALQNHKYIAIVHTNCGCVRDYSPWYFYDYACHLPKD